MAKINRLLILGLILRLLILVFSNSHPDVGNHLDWGNKFWQYGPASFYQQSVWKVSWPNQPIGSIYLFALLSQFNQKIFNFFWQLNLNFPIFPSNLIPILENNLHVWLVKLPFILADILIALFIFRYTKSKTMASLFLFNPAVIYNSTIWGQTDSLINLLSLIGIYFVYRRKFTFGIFLFLGSLLFKMSLLIYFPVFLWLLFLNRHQWQKWLLAIFLFLLFLILISLPFSGFNPSWFFHLYRDLVFNRQGNMLCGNAFNLWLIIFGVSLSRQSTPLLSSLGLIIFLLFTLPILFKFSRQKITSKNIWQILFFLSFGSFLFLTNMHERYLYPLLPLLPLLLFHRFLGLKTIIIISFLHLLNLYNLWFYPAIPWLKSLLESTNYLLPRLISLIFIGIYIKFWVKYLKSE